MKDKELLLKAIDDYDLLTQSGKIVLKSLIKLAIDDVVIINIKELSKLSKVSRPAVYSSLKILEDSGFIERQTSPGSRLSSFLLKPQRFNTIINYYTVRKNFLHG
ncbi:MarR-type HTH domain containing protein [uncultured Caudovirales phage]|uniref:MarR-type HTH domain containing protein n=1 Tax=uncultured Caudovirales phage TaxID=2100421 RepID=A0A6J5KVS9_9CAUD|nr:MarR-type HTH domain containing protein [uncultured Caudovirales phage]CAB4241032.1 MarR-type HTH domain containing protein [uncultured Caudovirales phage]